MGRRLGTAVIACALAVLTWQTDALAQHDPTPTTPPFADDTPPGSTPSSTPGSTGSTSPTTQGGSDPDDDDDDPDDPDDPAEDDSVLVGEIEGDAPEESSEPASVGAAETEDRTVEPGGSTTVTANFSNGAEPLPPGTRVETQLRDSSGGVVSEVEVVVNDDGTVDIEVTIPADAEPGSVYIVVVVLPSVNGRRPEVRVATITTPPAGTSATAAPGSAASGAVAAVGPRSGPVDPAAQAAAENAITPEVEAVIDEITSQIRQMGVSAYAERIIDGAELGFDGPTVLLDGKPIASEENGTGRGLVAALGLGAAAAGLIVLRRRQSPAGAQ